MIWFRKYIVGLVSAVLAFAALSIIESAMAQNQNSKKKQEENYHRPPPTKPMKPTIPEANRFQPDKIFLEYADSLYRPENQLEEFQIVKGSVKFRQGGTWMFCDSAYYYPQKNSMIAFGHVEMQQGDTLFVYADKLNYDGQSRSATLNRGPSRNKVILKNRKVTLTTDSLDYDLVGDRGWYTTGGILQDDVNNLTSMYGEYSPSSKEAKFRDNVILVNRKDGYRLYTEELDYNTATHIADINTQTRIEGANDTIITTQGWYNTATDRAELTARSIILHSDSNRNVTTLEGDSIIYDKKTRISQAYMFGNPSRNPRPMIITDTAHKVTLIGGYGEYNEGTRTALASDYPLLIEYSRPDTLFLRADTVLSLIEVVSPLQINSRIDSIIKMIPKDEDVVSEGSVTINEDTYSSADNLMPVTEVIEVKDTVILPPRDFHVARAIGKARFFNKDLQGIADTLLFKEQDSILYMFRKPVVWSGERQVYGNRIDVHFNDSVPDWAYLPESGMVAEHIEEDFYQQLTGSKMKAFFENKELKHLDVDGNVITILLPQEKDSTYNKLVNAESSFLTLDMENKDIKHLKMWPDVSGTVTPLFDVKPSQKYIQGFRWLENLRPVRTWYGDQLRWADELGEVPEELERYFDEPPLFNSPRPPR